MMRSLATLALVLTLAACDGGGSSNQQRPVLPDFPDGSGEILPEQRGLVFTYPLPGQTEIAPAAPIILRFSHALDPTVLNNAETLNDLFVIREVANGVLTGNPIPATVVAVPASEPLIAGNSLRLQPTSPLKEKTTYRVLATGPIPLTTGNVSLQPVGVPPLQFTTRAALQGASAAQSLTALSEFRIVGALPSAVAFPLDQLNGGFPLVDFSTLRLQFSQPVDAATVVYGNDAGSTLRLFKLGMLGTTTLVPAQVIVSGNRLSIDPDDDLDPSSRYRLELATVTQQGVTPQSVIRSRLTSNKNTPGAPLAFGPYTRFEFEPRDSGNTSRVRITAPSSGNGTVRSSLTGFVINEVPVASPLLGDSRNNRPSIAPAQGDLFADLAFAPNFRDFNPTIVPIRVPKNNQLTSVGLDVFIGGEVNANLSTEQLNITLITDANGLLLPNKFNRSVSAPSLVTLAMDVALTAKNKTSNGAFTQDVTHVVINGVAFIDEKREILKIEAVGVVELKVLGVDDAVGVLSLKLETNLDGPQGSLAPDLTAPLVDSWVPGEVPGAAGQPSGALLRPGDPIIVNFTEPVDRRTLRAGLLSRPIRLVCNDNSCSDQGDVPFTAELDGNSLIIRPTAGVQLGGKYTLTLTDAITDLAGNSLRPGPNQTGNWVRTFEIPPAVNSAVINRPPIVLSVSPGYPCPIEPGTRNIAADIQGRCAGGQADDDVLPLPEIDPRAPITVQFSQNIDLATVTLSQTCAGAGSFRVEAVNGSGACLSVVPGRLVDVGPRGLQFFPRDPWVKGVLYRYVLRSNGSNASSQCVAGGICSPAQQGRPALPLQTQLIAPNRDIVANRQRGGPDIEVVFRGGDPVAGTALNLRVLPILDVNANFLLDGAEGRSVLAAVVGGQLTEAPGLTRCEPGQALEGLTVPATQGRCIAANGALLQPDTVANDAPGDDGASFAGAATDFALGCPTGRQSEDTPGATSGQDCQGNQFLLISAALGATLQPARKINPAGPNTPENMEIPVAINPSIVYTSGTQIFASLGVRPDATPATSVLCGLPLVSALCDALGPVLDLVNGLLPLAVRDSTYDLPDGQVYTGPLVFRMRLPDSDGDGRRDDPIQGVIRFVDPDGAGPLPGKLVFSARLDLYTDIPEINPFAALAGIEALPIEHDVRSNVNLTSETDPLVGSGTIEVQGEVQFLPDGRLTIRLSNATPVRLTANLSALGGTIGGVLRVRVPTGRFIIDASLAPVKR